MINTSVNIPIGEKLVANYFEALVDCFFKILPIRESGEKTLPIYIKSLQIEILGCKEVIKELSEDPDILVLVSILQYLRDHPDSSVQTVKREVFKAISVCNKIQARYEKSEGMV